MVFYHAELVVSPRSDYALSLGFSDLVLVGGMLPSVLQTSLLFPLLADPRTSPALLLGLFSFPCDNFVKYRSVIGHYMVRLLRLF